MSIKKKCKNCELYAHCDHYDEIGDEDGYCKDWEIAFNIYQNMTEDELKEFIKENPEYDNAPTWEW